jgi:hypothetical protein
MVRIRLRDGDLFIHTTNPIFAGFPSVIGAMGYPALVFALHKLGRNCIDDVPLPDVFQPFECIRHTSHGFSFLSMKLPPADPHSDRDMIQ